MSNRNYYTILEVNESADQGAIKAAYYRLAQKFHPDKHGGDVGYTARFKEINEAYQVLSDQQKRQAYDLTFRVGKRGVMPTEIPFVYYLKFTASKNFLKQFEEFTIEYRFPSEARFFKRQKFDDWYIIEGPIIQHVEVLIEGIKRKETIIRYVLAPLKRGTLFFESPSVIINNKRVNATPLYIQVVEQFCSVYPSERASGTPLIIELEKTKEIHTTHFVKLKTLKRLVIIPVGSTYKKVKTKTNIIALVIALVFSLLLMNYLSSVLLHVLAGYALYVGLRPIVAHLLKFPSENKLIVQHSVYRYLVLDGYKISKREWLLYWRLQLYYLQKGLWR